MAELWINLMSWYSSNLCKWWIYLASVNKKITIDGSKTLDNILFYGRVMKLKLTNINTVVCHNDDFGYYGYWGYWSTPLLKDF